ncbi:hypothetical protein KY290_005286 [Solanum tuberosum]|uniref:Transposase-associated domain-containing protein n=1 Tax=Solanum tuberosum TaxID=4113 RepID=A0ABQ7WFH6_SOLTU|nr:hypothetical protein KY289_005674 [Solanum tuberosum]KAH0778859.1 hypothetical protein KY290_005286 [Solanum tuberosum]
MAPSKQWMQLVDNRLDEIYLDGVQKFLNYDAFQRTGEENEIRCPCIKCFNTILGTQRLGEPLSKSDTKSNDEDGDAIEECESDDEVEELLRDLYPNHNGGSTHTDCDDLLEEEPNVEAKNVYSLLKDFEQPLACPEGCIAEGYIAIECMTLCSRYLHRIDTKFNQPERNFDGGLKKCSGGLSIFCQPGRTLGAKTPCELEADELEQAHIYILKNCDEVLPFLEEFAQTHENARHLSDAEWNRQFIEWFKDRVAQLHKGYESRMMEDLLSLSRGPTQYLRCSNGYVVNGYRFHVEDYDKKLRTQNCGVVVLGENDKDSENLDYYGDDDFVSVNPGRFLKINEPFVLANQASQVFYANDNSNKGWQVVMKTQPRDSFEIIEKMNDDIVELGSPSQKKRKRTNEVQDETSQDLK